jgi:hypothetical protein
LKSSSSNLVLLVLTGLRFEVKEIAKKVEIGLYAQERFIEMDKDCDVKNRIVVEMMELDAIMKEKIAKEIRSWESKTALKKMLK